MLILPQLHVFLHSFYFSSIDVDPFPLVAVIISCSWLDYHLKKLGTDLTSINFLLISIKDISFYLSVQHATVSLISDH